MRVEIIKIVTLNDSDKNILRSAIDVLDGLNEATNEEYEYDRLVADIEEILYHEPWEVEYEV